MSDNELTRVRMEDSLVKMRDHQELTEEKETKRKPRQFSFDSTVGQAAATGRLSSTVLDQR